MVQKSSYESGIISRTTVIEVLLIVLVIILLLLGLHIGSNLTRFAHVITSIIKVASLDLSVKLRCSLRSCHNFYNATAQWRNPILIKSNTYNN